MVSREKEEHADENQDENGKDGGHDGYEGDHEKLTSGHQTCRNECVHVLVDQSMSILILQSFKLTAKERHFEQNEQNFREQ